MELLYVTHQMDQHAYDTLRRQSSALFKNGLVLPVAWALLDGKVDDAATGAAEIRRVLGGRAESNQIREVLMRLTDIDAVEELPYPGRPHPRMWVRRRHPFWAFSRKWAEDLGAATTADVDSV